MTAEVLLGRVAVGDRRAFAEFHGLFEERVLCVIRSVVRDRAMSEEVAQEVHLEIWQKASQFTRGRGTVATWVLTMARNRAIDCVRASQASKNRDIRAGRRELEPCDDSVWEGIAVRLAHDRVLQAMSVLTDRQREAVTLAYINECSITEVAEILRVPRGTASTRLRDGLIRLRAELDTSILSATPSTSDALRRERGDTRSCDEGHEDGRPVTR